MGLSWIFLRLRPSLIATGAALMIIGSSALSALPHTGGDGVNNLWYSVTIFACGQLFYSAEKVYEEYAFKKYKVTKC